MKTYFLPDNTMVEITTSDTYSGPDGKPGCQRTSKNIDWIRINNGKWEPSPFRTHYQSYLEIKNSHSLEQLRKKLKFAALGIL
jgi:hypothetical protein